MSSQLHAPAVLPPGKESQLFNKQEAGWGPEPTWTLWGTDNYLDSARTQTPAVAIPTGLPGYTVSVKTEIELLSSSLVANHITDASWSPLNEVQLIMGLKSNSNKKTTEDSH